MYPMPLLTGGANIDIVTQIMAIFTAIGNWFVSSVTSMLPIFYAPDTGLTIIGVLTCCGLGVSVILLVLKFVKRFFKWG